MTTDNMVLPRLSSVLRFLGFLKSYENSAWSLVTWPSIALAYGSSSSLLGSQRWPFSGS